MKNLVPRFILQRYAQGEYHGRFSAVGLFVDLSGFTKTTETLMQHGKYGAEALAGIMHNVFTPLIQTIYEHGGMISGFAGDAFTALFREDVYAHSAGARMHALAAAWEIRQIMSGGLDQTVLGHSFSFAVKLGMAEGPVEWGIFLSAYENVHHAYYFSGEAVMGAAVAEKYAGQDDIIITPELAKQYESIIETEHKDGFQRIISVPGNLPAPCGINMPQIDDEHKKPFQSRELLNVENLGEFRYVFTVFLSIESSLVHDELERVIQFIFDLQSRYGGYLNGIDFGDKGCNLLFFWGAPTAYEHDATHVMNFLLHLKQEAFFRFRCSVTYQFMYAGQVGGDLRHEYGCYGRGINLAARQMVEALWEEIWTDEKTYEKVGKQFQMALVGGFDFKGFAERMNVYSFLGEKEIQSVGRYCGEMFGRSADLEEIEKALRPVRQGRFAGVIGVFGEAGMGKSRLTETLRDMLLTMYGETFSWIVCRADEISRGPFNPIKYFLRRYFNQQEGSSDAAKKESFNARLDELIDKIQDEDLRFELDRTRSILGALIDLYWDNSLYSRLEPRLKFENTLSALKSLFLAESLIMPVIIEMEDAHWLDSDSIQYMRFFTRNIETHPVAIIINSRKPEDAEMFDPEIPVFAFHLESFDLACTKAFAEDFLGEQADESLVDMLTQKTGGNPLFIEQMTRYLMEKDMLVNTGEGLAPKDDNMVIPDDVRAMIIARLDQLPQQGKQLVQTASVLGREFDGQILASMWRRRNDGANFEIDLNKFEQIWKPVQGSRYIFQHDLVRDSAYHMQLSTELGKLHKIAAEEIETFYRDNLQPHYGNIAYQYGMADVRHKAVEYYEKAGDLAKSNYQNEQAITYYDNMLCRLDENENEKRFDALLKKGGILELIGRWREAENIYREALDIATGLGNEIGVAQSTRRLAWRHYQKGELQKAMDYLNRALQSCRSVNDEKGISIIIGRIGSIHMRNGDYAKAKECFKEDLMLSKKLAHEKGMGFAVGNLGNIHYRKGDFDLAMEYYLERLEIFRKINEQPCIAVAYGGLGDVHWRQGNYEQGMSYYIEKLKLSEELGDLQTISNTLTNIGAIFSEKGDYGEALSHLERARNVATELGDKEVIARSTRLIGAAYRRQGSYSHAISWLNKAEELQRELKDMEEISIIYYNLGCAYQMLEDCDKALTYIKRALGISEEISNKTGICINLGRLGSIYHTVGKAEDAVVCFENSIKMCRDLGLRFWLSSYLILMAEFMLERKQYDEARALNSEGLQIADELGNERNIRHGKKLAERIDAEFKNIAPKSGL
ncbi:MAG: adenylate/guanylate cyclase domain-containing protein [Nitrospirae bacterium]|nr:MAG: adenylate/guanylate cyclase domain-containing protein [Nitrospirota bacterium]